MSSRMEEEGSSYAADIVADAATVAAAYAAATSSDDDDVAVLGRNNGSTNNSTSTDSAGLSIFGRGGGTDRTEGCTVRRVRSAVSLTSIKSNPSLGNGPSSNIMINPMNVPGTTDFFIHTTERSYDTTSSIRMGGVGEGIRRNSTNSSNELMATLRSPTFCSSSSRSSSLVGSAVFGMAPGEELTVNKLRFGLVGLYGRDDEQQILREIILDHMFDSNKNNSHLHHGHHRRHKRQSDLRMPPHKSSRGKLAAALQDEGGDRSSDLTRGNMYRNGGRESKRLRRDLVLIGGPSGVGKSSLAETVRPLVIRGGGAYLSGKFDRQSMVEPYSAIWAACSDLCCQLLARKGDSPTELDRIRKSIVDRLGEVDMNDLIRIVPDLAAVVDRPTASKLVSDKLAPPNDKMNQPVSSTVIDGTSDEGSTTAFLQLAKNRFHYLFRKFFRVVGSHFEQLVLMLDDLQWADLASLDLLEALLIGDDVVHNTSSPHTSCKGNYGNNADICCGGVAGCTKSLVVIGSYRSDEVAPTHMLSKLIRDMKHRCQNANVGGYYVHITEIEIGNLREDHIRQFLVDLLSASDTSSVAALSKICHQRTLGNAFFLIQYLTMLHNLCLLEYNLGLTRWMWDVNRIYDETSATENVVDLVMMKMSELPPSALQLLQVAACLGSTFTQSTLCTVWENLTRAGGVIENKSFQESIAEAVEMGLLEKNDRCDMTYQWVHDSILEATLALMSPQELKDLQFEVGNVLIQQYCSATLNEGDPPNQLNQHLKNRDSTIFIAVNLLNAGTPSGLSIEEKVKLAELNLNAATTSVQVSAYASASGYVSRGIDFLPDNYWDSHSDLALELHSLGAEVEGCLGHAPEMDQHCNEVIHRDISLMDKLRVYHVLLHNAAERQKLPEAIKLCLKVLKDLGCTFQKNRFIITVQTVLGVLKYQSHASRKTLANVTNMTCMSDRRQIEVMRLIDKLATYCYLSGSNLFALTMFRRLDYTFKHGICESSAIDLAGMGMVLTGKLFDFQAGSTYARYTLLLLERRKSNSAYSRALFLVYGFVLPWTQSTQSCLKHLLRAYEAGMASGDTESAMFSLMSYMCISFQSGRPLATIAEDCRVYRRQMHDLKREKARKQTKTIFQTVLNLIGQNHGSDSGEGDGTDDDPCLLTGESMDEDVTIQTALAEHDVAVLSMIQAFRAQLYALFGQYERGAAYAIAVGSSLANQIPCSTLVMTDPFFRSLSLYGMARRYNHGGAATGRRMYYLHHANQARKVIKNYVRKGNPNSRHLESFLNAEHASLDKRTHQVAMKHYEVATVMASRSGFIQDAALANEHFGKFLLNDIGDEEMGAFRIHQSIRLYNEWGSRRKAWILEKEFEDLLFAHPDSNWQEPVPFTVASQSVCASSDEEKE